MKKYYLYGFSILLLLTIIGIFLYYPFFQLKKQFYNDCVNKKITLEPFTCEKGFYIYKYSLYNPQIVIILDSVPNGVYPIIQFKAEVINYYKDINGKYNIVRTAGDFPILKTYFFNDLNLKSWDDGMVIFKNDFIRNVLNKSITNKYITCESFFSSTNKQELLDCMKDTDLIYNKYSNEKFH